METKRPRFWIVLPQWDDSVHAGGWGMGFGINIWQVSEKLGLLANDS